MTTALIFFLLNFGFSMAQDNNPIGCFISGECTRSEYEDVTISENPDECLEFCGATPNCNYFTHYQDSSACFAFVDCAELTSSSCTDCISGDVTCTEQPCFLSGRCDGTLLYFAVAENPDECLDACKSDPECSYFSFDSSDNFCILTTNCQTVDECDTCVYGNRGCENQPMSSTTAATEPPVIGKSGFLAHCKQQVRCILGHW